jgi:RsmE family RNA methyltransferase
MNQIVIEQSEYSSDTRTVCLGSGERLTHLNTVIKAHPGDELKLCVLNQFCAMGILKSLSSEEAIIEIKEKLEFPDHSIHLLIGMSRPPTIKKVLEHATCMGIKAFHFIGTSLSERSYMQSKITNPEQYEKYLKLGLAQSARYYKMPQVFFHKNIYAAPYSQLPDSRFVLERDTDSTFLKYQPLTYPLCMAIGPERGFSDEEINYLEEKSFQAVRISNTTLRVEHAVFGSISQLELLHL